MNKYLRRLEGIKKAKKVISANPNWRNNFHVLIKTRKPCSCWMCRNRQSMGDTRQEIKSKTEMFEDLKEA